MYPQLYPHYSPAVFSGPAALFTSFPPKIRSHFSDSAVQQNFFEASPGPWANLTVFDFDPGNYLKTARRCCYGWPPKPKVGRSNRLPSTNKNGHLERWFSSGRFLLWSYCEVIPFARFLPWSNFFLFFLCTFTEYHEIDCLSHPSPVFHLIDAWLLPLVVFDQSGTDQTDSNANPLGRHPKKQPQGLDYISKFWTVMKRHNKGKIPKCGNAIPDKLSPCIFKIAEICSSQYAIFQWDAL